MELQHADGTRKNIAIDLSDADRQRWLNLKASLIAAKRERLRLRGAWLYWKMRQAAAATKMPPWLAGLVVGSLLAVSLSVFLVISRIGDSLLLLGSCLLSYAIGGGGTFLLFWDEHGENDANRIEKRRERVAAAGDKLHAIGLKIAGLEAELSLQDKAIDAAMEAAKSRVFAAAEEARRAAEAQAAAAVQNAEGARRVAEERARIATAELEAAQAGLQAVQNAFDLATERLLSIDPGRLYPDELERFAADVFAHLGYLVRQTGQTGDQGVDVLAEKRGLRLAIQVKCYNNNVGNSAVQEVFAGMMHYRCHKCLVLTNHYFTSSAIALAQSTGCILIDRQSIPSLIRGEFSF